MNTSYSKRGPGILHYIHHMYVMLSITGTVGCSHIAGERTASGVPVHVNHSEAGAPWRNLQMIIPEA